MATLSTASTSIRLSSLASISVDDSGPAAAVNNTTGSSASELGKSAAGGERWILSAGLKALMSA